MKIIRPQLARRIEGRTSRASLTPLSTLTSKNLTQSVSGIASNGFGSKIPRLLTRISTPGYSRTTASADDATLRSPANPCRSPPVVDLSDATTASTAALDRPLMITRAPSRASVVAIASPMPAVLPVTSASLPCSCRSIGQTHLRLLFHLQNHRGKVLLLPQGRLGRIDLESRVCRGHLRADRGCEVENQPQVLVHQPQRKLRAVVTLERSSQFTNMGGSDYRSL